MKADIPHADKVNDADGNEPRKRPYVAPVLTRYGAIASLTRGDGSGGTDTGSTSD
jgi:hypothetical protein